MSIFVLDTTVMVSILMTTHEHHGRATTAVAGRLDAGDTMVIVAHTLLETYSTLTKYPGRNRSSAAVARAAISGTFLQETQVATLSADAYIQLLDQRAAQGTLGGQVYDAAIVACARSAGADELLTFNERHFRPFEGNGLTVTVP